MARKKKRHNEPKNAQELDELCKGIAHLLRCAVSAGVVREGVAHLLMLIVGASSCDISLSRTLYSLLAGVASDDDNVRSYSVAALPTAIDALLLQFRSIVPFLHNSTHYAAHQRYTYNQTKFNNLL